jgi:hypothetical protein
MSITKLYTIYIKPVKNTINNNIKGSHALYIIFYLTIFYTIVDYQNIAKHILSLVQLYKNKRIFESSIKASLNNDLIMHF